MDRKRCNPMVLFSSVYVIWRVFVGGRIEMNIHSWIDFDAIVCGNNLQQLWVKFLELNATTKLALWKAINCSFSFRNIERIYK